MPEYPLSEVELNRQNIAAGFGVVLLLILPFMALGALKGYISPDQGGIRRSGGKRGEINRTVPPGEWRRDRQQASDRQPETEAAAPNDERRTPAWYKQPTD